MVVVAAPLSASLLSRHFSVVDDADDVVVSPSVRLLPSSSTFMERREAFAYPPSFPPPPSVSNKEIDISARREEGRETREGRCEGGEGRNGVTDATDVALFVLSVLFHVGHCKRRRRRRRREENFFVWGWCPGGPVSAAAASSVRMGRHC
jgi:hypothetical protein